ncbi:threonyl-trna synthetase [Methylobacterium fujisawaense]|uniref:threonyl-trna synthetase n=1 Tax=Methylobacterium fujisawaense TaxID=107400 RepID=UPI00313F200E
MLTKIRYVCALTLFWVSSTVLTRAEDAPFGLSWGPVTTVPRPSMIDREANITALFYFRDQPPASGRDTQQVVLEVCQAEGLQQIIWVSRTFADSEIQSAYAAIYQEGIRRYGEPRVGGTPQATVWPDGRTLLAVRRVVDGGKRIIMVASGELYERCSLAHKAATGHPATVHISDLLEPWERLMAP